jgi:hypothetical protein
LDFLRQAQAEPNVLKKNKRDPLAPLEAKPLILLGFMPFLRWYL